MVAYYPNEADPLGICFYSHSGKTYTVLNQHCISFSKFPSLLMNFSIKEKNHFQVYLSFYLFFFFFFPNMKMLALCDVSCAN